MSPASIIQFTNSPSLEELSKSIKRVIEDGAKGILLFTCISNAYDAEKVNRMLVACSLPLCGGVFPKIIYQGKNYSQGAIVIGLMMEPVIVNYSILNKSDPDLKHYVHTKSKKLENYQNFIMISDALCSKSENFIDHFYDFMGFGVTTIGGGAGSLDGANNPVIFTNQGLVMGLTQVIALPCSINNSIGHGWELLDGPYLVTSSEGHFVYSLNYKPTFNIYKETIQSRTSTPLCSDFFATFAKQYPLGIISWDGEILVRDPIKTNGSYLECVGNVPVNSMVYLLQSSQEKMIDASTEGAQNLSQQGPFKTLLLFDCISRDFFMGDAIDNELEAIQDQFPNTSLVGAMAIGEIANTPSGSIRLLNKSTVLGSF